MKKLYYEEIVPDKTKPIKLVTKDQTYLTDLFEHINEGETILYIVKKLDDSTETKKMRIDKIYKTLHIPTIMGEFIQEDQEDQKDQDES